jgi:hypothetical protein
MLVFALCSSVLLRNSVDAKWLAPCAPLVVLWVYYGYADSWHLTQVEILVALLMFISVALLGWAYRSAVGRVWGFAVAGATAAIAVGFKLVFAPMFIAFVLVATFHQVAISRPASRFFYVAGLWAAFSVGVAVVLAAMGWLFWMHGALQEFLWTTFVYPVKAFEAVPPAPYSRLFVSVARYLALFTPWIPLVLLAGVRAFRPDEPVTTRLMCTWLVAGAAVILIQRFSWWPYHMSLLFVPTGVLAVRGVDVAWHWLQRCSSLSPGLRLVALALILLPPLGAVAFPVMSKAQAAIRAVARGEEGIDGYQISRSAEYQQASEASPYLVVMMRCPVGYTYSAIP